MGDEKVMQRNGKIEGVLFGLEKEILDCAARLGAFETQLAHRYSANVIAFALASRLTNMLDLLVMASEYTPQQVRSFFALLEDHMLSTESAPRDH